MDYPGNGAFIVLQLFQQGEQRSHFPGLIIRQTDYMPASMKEKWQRMQESIVFHTLKQLLGKIHGIVLGSVVSRPLTNHPRPHRCKTSGRHQVIRAADLENVAFAGVSNAQPERECPEREVDMSVFVGMPVGQKEGDIETVGILMFEKLVEIKGRQVEFFLHNVLVMVPVRCRMIDIPASKIVKILFYH